MKNIRILIIGLVTGGGIGAKIGAYLSTIMDESIKWSMIELGAGIGIGAGCIVSLIIILAKAGVFSPKENELENTSPRGQVVTGRI